MIDLGTFVSAIKVTWIRRLYNNSETPWDKLAKMYLGSIQKTVLFRSCYSLNMARKTTNKFWSESLYCWSIFIDSIPINNASDALSKPLWNNPTVSKANLFLPDWYNNGIISIADILGGNGKFISQNDLKTVYHIRTIFLEHHRVITCVKKYLSKQKDASKMHKKPAPIQIKSLANQRKEVKIFTEYWPTRTWYMIPPTFHSGNKLWVL